MLARYCLVGAAVRDCRERLRGVPAEWLAELGVGPPAGCCGLAGILVILAKEEKA